METSQVKAVIRDWIAQSQVSQSAVATKLGWSRQQLNRLLNSQSDCSLGVLRKVVEAAGGKFTCVIEWPEIRPETRKDK